jgi:hypothetical protein
MGPPTLSAASAGPGEALHEESIDHTKRHVEIVRDVLTKLGLDPEKARWGRR